MYIAINISHPNLKDVASIKKNFGVLEHNDCADKLQVQIKCFKLNTSTWNLWYLVFCLQNYFDLLWELFFSNSWSSALNFKRFSRSLKQFFLTVGQSNFGNKIPFTHSMSWVSILESPLSLLITQQNDMNLQISFQLLALGLT